MSRRTVVKLTLTVYVHPDDAEEVRGEMREYINENLIGMWAEGRESVTVEEVEAPYKDMEEFLYSQEVDDEDED